MSLVRDFYRDHHSSFDDLHKLLDKEPELRALLPDIRARALACCGAEAGKGGKLELVVADPNSWDKIAAEQAVVQDKLDAIEAMVQKLDSIFAEMSAAGIEAREPTIRSIWLAEQSRRTKAIDPHTGTNIDRWGHRVPQKQDARLVAWGERAEAALDEARRAVDGQQVHAAAPPANPLAELAGRAKSLFA